MEGGRTFNGKDGRPVFVLRKMVQGRAYTIHLDASSETEAEAELALFMRDPEGYSTKREARQQQQESAVYVNAETVGRFLDSMRRAGTTARYVGAGGSLRTSSRRQRGARRTFSVCATCCASTRKPGCTAPRSSG